MKNRLSYKTALCGIISAVSLVMMFFTGVIPVLSYALPAIAGAMLIVIVIEINKKWALLCYVAVSLLALFLTPDKEAAFLFIFLLGYYPIVKSFLEKIKLHIAEWAAKLLLFNSAVLIAYKLLINVLGMNYLLDEFKEFGKYSIPIFIVAANVAFVLYDFALTGLITTYINVIRPRIQKRIK